MGNEPRNQVICPRCGEVKAETPPGTIVLPIAAPAGRRPDDSGRCGCGRRREPDTDGAG
jgi:hypothetical protein